MICSLDGAPINSLSFRLVCGDIRGNFKKFFAKIEKLNQKSGPFEFLLCVGDFFGDNNDELIAFKNGNKIGMFRHSLIDNH